MYIPKYFETDGVDTLLKILPEASFCQLITTGDDQLPLVTHLPVAFDPKLGESGTIYGHVAKANPHANLLDGRTSLIVFNGPHAYVSPRYYATDLNVPTWNYVAVHAYGVPEVITGQEEAVDVLRQLTNENEDGSENPWTVDGYDQKRLHAMLNAISIFKMPVTKLDAKAKLGQNKKTNDKQALSDALADTELADWQKSIL